jgi:hypothetical protein
MVSFSSTLCAEELNPVLVTRGSVIRKISLALYGISVIPIANITTIAGILGITTLFEVVGLFCIFLPVFVCVKVISIIILPSRGRSAEGRARTREQRRANVAHSLVSRRLIFYSSIASMAIITIVLIVSTEQMIHWSSSMIQPGEGNWTFGQTLALLLLVIPFWQAVGDIWGKGDEVNIDCVKHRTSAPAGDPDPPAQVVKNESP